MDLKSKKVYTSCHIIFEESLFPPKQHDTQAPTEQQLTIDIDPLRQWLNAPPRIPQIQQSKATNLSP